MDDDDDEHMDFESDEDSEEDYIPEEDYISEIDYISSEYGNNNEDQEAAPESKEDKTVRIKQYRRIKQLVGLHLFLTLMAGHELRISYQTGLV